MPYNCKVFEEWGKRSRVTETVQPKRTKANARRMRPSDIDKRERMLQYRTAKAASWMAREMLPRCLRRPPPKSEGDQGSSAVL